MTTTWAAARCAKPFRELDDLSACLKFGSARSLPMPGVAAAKGSCANVRSANRTYGDKKRWTKRIKKVASSVSKKAERKGTYQAEGLSVVGGGWGARRKSGNARCQARNLMAINEDV